MNNKAIIYHCTSDIFGSFRDAQLVQQVFGRQLDGWDRILVSNEHHPKWRDEQITLECNPDPAWPICWMKNVALSRAAEKGYEWVWMMDADFVVVQAPSKMPETGFAQPIAFWDQPDRKTFPVPPSQVCLLRIAQRPVSYFNVTPTVRLSSCFILGRDVYTKVRYPEQMRGVMFDDTCVFDYVTNYLGVKPAYTDSVLLHMWHEPREKQYHKEHNKLVYHSAMDRLWKQRKSSS